VAHPLPITEELRRLTVVTKLVTALAARARMLLQEERMTS
jgi:hypothetical protein